MDVGKIYLKRRKHWFHVSLVKVGSSQVEMYRKWAPCGLVGTLWSPCGHPGGAVQEMGTLWAPTLLSLLPSASVWPRKPQRTPAAPAANPIIKKPPNHPGVNLLCEKKDTLNMNTVGEKDLQNVDPNTHTLQESCVYPRLFSSSVTGVLFPGIFLLYFEP